MSLYPLNNVKKSNPILLSALCAAGLSFGVVVPKAQADEWNKKTILTVDETIQVQDDVLTPGKYVFKLLDSRSDRHIVEIYNADESHLIDTILAIPDYRMDPAGRQFVFYETPAGAAKALHAWYYPGDNFGQEFLYPKNLKMLTEAVMPSLPPAPESQVPARSEAQSEAQPEPQPETAVQPSEPAPVQEQVQEQQTEIAQNNTPSTPAPSTDTTPSTLPKTASVYPLIGLSGLISLGLFSMIRLARRA